MNFALPLRLVSWKFSATCYFTSGKNFRMILDFACPTTVVGMKWIRDFFSCLSYDQKQNIGMNDTQRVYRFGG